MVNNNKRLKDKTIIQIQKPGKYMV